MIYFLLILVIFAAHYIIHFINTMINFDEDNIKYGWATIFTFKRLYKSKKFIRDYKASYECDNNNGFNYENLFMFNDIYLLFDPISFVLVKLFCWWKFSNDYTFESNLFKTYTKIEAEKILDKLTE